MDSGELEGLARWIWRKSGEAETPIRIADALGIEVFSVPNLREVANIATLDGRPVIAVRASYRDRNFAIAHELGHYALTLSGVTEHEESWADYIGAALVCREPFGGTWEEIAARHRATQTLVALRWGEVTGEPVAVVAPTGTRARGWWPSGVRKGPGIVAVRLTDARRREALICKP